MYANARKKNLGLLAGSLLVLGVALGSALVVAGLNGKADPQAPPNPQNASVPPRIIPWIEINDPAMPMSQVDRNVPKERAALSLLEHGLEGLAFWAQLTDTVIVTTRPGQVEKLYPALMDRKPPNLRIIGGIKTFLLPGCTPGDKQPYDFANAPGWKAQADEVRAIMRLTGSREVLLENESSLTPFHTGKGDISLEKLRQSLIPIRETGAQVWTWTPFFMGTHADMRRRPEATEALVQSFAEAIPDIVFLAPYAGWYDWRSDNAESSRRRRMIEAVRDSRFRDLLYVTVDGFVHFSPQKKKRCYTVSEAMLEVSRLGRETVIYPGAGQWVAVAREYAEHATAKQK